VRDHFLRHINRDYFIDHVSHTGDDGSVRVSKTGLGSSAAMTTALCGALLHTMGCVDLLATNNKLRIDDYYRCIHNVAQLAHAIAQGKVGSGFDVSSAVYGTQIYQRFDPENVNRAFEMMNALDISPVENAAQIFDLLNDESVWTQRCTRFQLPPGLDIVLGDVCGGSSSSSMVSNQGPPNSSQLLIVVMLCFHVFCCLLCLNRHALG
jgi:phosphomevalonate kinase